jgi:hypothetical protein
MVPGCGKRAFAGSLAITGAMGPAMTISRKRSDAQREQLNHADPDQQHDERHGIIVQPISKLCAHDIPLVLLF